MDYCFNTPGRITQNVGDDKSHWKSDALLPTVATAGTADCNKMGCQMQNTHSGSIQRADRTCVGEIISARFTLRPSEEELSIRCPLNPLMNTGTRVSLTSAPPLSSDSQAKPAIGLKSAKHNPSVLLVFWTTLREERQKEQKDVRSLGPPSSPVVRGSGGVRHNRPASRCLFFLV